MKTKIKIYFLNYVTKHTIFHEKNVESIVDNNMVTGHSSVGYSLTWIRAFIHTTRY